MSKKSLWLEKFKLTFNDCLGQFNVGNQFMANEMGLSKRQLDRKIKDLSGLSTNQFMRKYRLQKAMEFIQSDQFYTVQQIGYAVGYKNIHYFSKEFEKEFGESPMQILIKRRY